MKRIAVTALIGLGLCGSAQAAVDVGAAMDTARSYWANRGVPPVCAPTWTIDRLDGPFAGGGYGWGPPVCTVQFDPAVLDYSRRDACLLAIHEYGHALGLQHTDADRYPIMVGGEQTYTVHTPFCDGAAKIGVLRGDLRLGHYKPARRHKQLGGRVEDPSGIAHRVRIIAQTHRDKPR